MDTILSGRDVLVVDDEPLLRKRLKRFLEGEGANVIAAASFEEGRSALTSMLFDYAMVDVYLPKRILLRAVGSGLAAQGVSGVLADTTLRLFRGPSVIESNDDWDAHPEKAQLESFMSSAGTFAIEEGSGDSCLLYTSDAADE